MNHVLAGEIFRCARDYHGALREYAAAMRAGADIENATQRVIGTRVRYRAAIDRLLEADDAKSIAIVATHGRLERLRRLLVATSRRYNLLQSPPPRGNGANGRQATASSRPMSCRTAS